MCKHVSFFELTYLLGFQHCNLKMGLHLQYSAVYKDAVAYKHPGNFVAALEGAILSVKGLALSPSYTWYP